jgi:hypothetical protein
MLQADKTLCLWETEEEMVGTSLMEWERVKMGLVIVVDHDDYLLTYLLTYSLHGAGYYLKN